MFVRVVTDNLAGSFRAPPPGTKTTQPYDDKNLKLGTKVEDLNDPFARKNFRVVVIRPEEVESVDLTDPSTSRRHRYLYNQKTDSWDYEELWP